MVRRSLLVAGGLMAVAVRGGELRLSLDEYRDKMQGAWIGQMVGVEWGRSTEFKWSDAVIPERSVPAWKPSLINGGFDNDDLYVEMTFLKTLEDYGLEVSHRQAGIDFANSRYMLWCANEAGRNNLRMGVAPPDCSHPFCHQRPNDIDYQIEADYAGIISPGLPQEVVRLGTLFGRLVNYGDGVCAGQFVGALYAKAFFTNDIDAILDAGLAAIPAESDYAQMVRDVRAWHREQPTDWIKTWENIRAKYSKKYNPAMKDTNGTIDARLNGALIVLGLVYGEGDLDRSMVIAMRGGYDSDCNPSNVGGILMCARGAKALDPKYASALDRQKKFVYTNYDFAKLCAVSESLARQVVVRNGGRVEKDAEGREWFVIPERTPVPDAYVPSWRATAPVGSRYSQDELAKVRDAVSFKNIDGIFSTNPTVRVQAALDELEPGWQTTENGGDSHPGCRMLGDVRLGKESIRLSILTAPPARGKAVTLFRTVTVPMDDPALHFEVVNLRGGDFRLEVKVDGVRLLATDLADSDGARSDLRLLRPFDLSLAPWAGKTVKIELSNCPTGWNNEAAIWHGLRIGSAVN